MAVVVEHPVNSNVPFDAYISEVPAELYSLPFESNIASWVIFVQPVKFPAGSKLKALKVKRYVFPLTCSQTPWPGDRCACGVPEVESISVPPNMNSVNDAKVLIPAPV